jgi:hypothetical protein
MKLYGQQIINWEGLKEIPPEQHKIKILEAVADFMKRVGKMPIDNVKMTGADANLTSGIAPVAFRLTDTLYSPDRGYEVLFDEFDMRSSTSKSFDLLDVSGGVTFYQQLPGEEAKLSKLPSAAKAAVAMLRFTGGFPILDDWLRFNEYYKIDELTSDTVKRWYDKKATLFYGLLVALGAGINQTFATDDVTTINNACVTILNDLEALGYPVTENNRFYITCNPTLKMRISKALAAAFINPNTNNNEIVWPIAGIISTTKIASTSYYVSLPGGKNKRGEWEDLNAREPQRNELKLGADHVWTGAYNGAIGEAKQHRRCALS